MPDANANSLHIQISGDMPWCVLGWHTYPEHDLEPSLMAIYGPVATREDADSLVATLLEAFPAQEDNYTVMPLFKVQMNPGAAVAT